jgi:hypothetical protein
MCDNISVVPAASVFMVEHEDGEYFRVRVPYTHVALTAT